MDFDYNRIYDFARCAYCYGPSLGYIEAKCPRLEYGDGVVKKFETYLKGLEGFKTALWQREKEKEEIKAKAMADMVKLTVEGLGGNTQGTQGTT